MLVIKDLTKTYSSGVQALKGVSLDLSPGVFGLLGPNGSGKTTLMKIVATLLQPDSSKIEMNGSDLLARKSLSLPALTVSKCNLLLFRQRRLR